MKMSKLMPGEDLASLGRIQILVALGEVDTHDVEVQQSAEIIYRELQARGLEVLYDDRIVSPASRLPPSEFELQIPLKIEISSHGLAVGGWVELEDRETGVIHKLLLEEAVERAEELTHGLGL